MRRLHIVFLILVGVSVGMGMVGISALTHVDYPLWLEIGLVAQGITSTLLAAQAASKGTAIFQPKRQAKTDCADKS